MHVVLISTVFAEYSALLVNSLSDRPGVRITFIVPKDFANNIPKSYLSILLKKSNVDVQISAEARLIAKTCLQTIYTAYRLISDINKIKPDIIHIQESGNYPVFFALPFIKKYPLIHTIHDIKMHPGSKDPTREMRRRTAVKFSDKIIVHGKNLRKSALSTFNLKAEDVYVVPHGALSLYDDPGKKNIKEEWNSILFFGYIQEYKGLEYLIRAMPMVNLEIPDARLIIAGKCRDFRRYEGLMEDKSRFEIHDRFIPPEMVPELFCRASMVVLPYIEASQSGILHTAYAFKKPVITTNVGGLPDVVDDGRTGFVVPPKDLKALADAIVTLLKDNALRKQMGEIAYEKTKKEISWDNIAEKTIGVYTEAIRNRYENH